MVATKDSVLLLALFNIVMNEIVNMVRGVSKEQNFNYNSIQCLCYYLLKHISKGNLIFIIQKYRGFNSPLCDGGHKIPQH